jgi:hypothetical protein
LVLKLNHKYTSFILCFVSPRDHFPFLGSNNHLDADGSQCIYHIEPHCELQTYSKCLHLTIIQVAENIFIKTYVFYCIYLQNKANNSTYRIINVPLAAVIENSSDFTQPESIYCSVQFQWQDKKVVISAFLYGFIQGLTQGRRHACHLLTPPGYKPELANKTIEKMKGKIP